MSQGIPPSPQPDPRPLSLDSLEQQLRSLPPPALPAALPTKLIAAIPPAAASTSLAAAKVKFWLWMVGIGAAAVLVSALVIFWLTHGKSNAPAATANDAPTATSMTVPTGPGATAASKAIQSFQQSVQADPYNADAWFNLAKAQAAAHLSDDAISSAQKALDIAHSRNQAAFAQTLESWLRSYRANQPGQSAN